MIHTGKRCQGRAGVESDTVRRRVKGREGRRGERPFRLVFGMGSSGFVMSCRGKGCKSIAYLELSDTTPF